MPIVNCSIFSSQSKALSDFILQNFAQDKPNFSHFLVLTPSYEMAKQVKLEFANKNVIIPKVLALAEVEEDFLQTFSEKKQISDLQNKVYLYSIIKKYFPNFSSSSVFSYIEDFLKLYNHAISQELNLLESLKKLEELAPNMAQKLQTSLIRFFKILITWNKFKTVNKTETRLEGNLRVLSYLVNHLHLLPFKQIFMVYGIGTNALQIKLMKAILNQNGFIFLNGLEVNGERAISTSYLKTLKKSLQSEVIFLNEQPLNIKYKFCKFENLPKQAFQVAMHIKHLQKNNTKIGVICYSSKTADLLALWLEKVGISFSSVFGKFKGEQFLILIENLIKVHANPLNALFLLKHQNLKFEENLGFEFEKELRSPNLNAKIPFIFVKFEATSFYNFIENIILELEKLLKEEALNCEEWQEFKKNLNLAKEEVEDFKMNELEEYKEILFNYLKNLKYKITGDENVFLLSPIEARGKTFDTLFITDLNSENLPKKSSENKIINTYLQEVLMFSSNQKAIEWLDFTYFLYSSANIFLCYNVTNFEEKSKLEPSIFLSHAIQEYNITEFTEEFYIQKAKNLLNFEPLSAGKISQKLSPSAIKKLINNPFTYYVENVLKLKTPVKISSELEASLIGTVIHLAIYKFFKYKESIFEFCKNWLIERGYKYYFILHSKALMEIEEFFIKEKERLLLNPPIKIMMEEEIEAEFEAFTLFAKPDKLEFYENEIFIIDYKVYGEKISLNHVLCGLEPQLPIQALILNQKYKEKKIRMFYYYIKLKDENERVLKEEIEIFETQEELKQIEKWIENLIKGVSNFFYNENDDKFYYNHLLRKL